jgi:replicative DNA helicase
MSLFKDRLAEIQYKKERKEKGLSNCIPFSSGYPRLAKHIPGIVQGQQWLVTAGSGIGKTQLTKHLFIMTLYSYIKKNPGCGLSLKIFYFALEESKEEIIDQFIVNRLHTLYGISINTYDLESMYDTPLDDATLAKIMECQEYFEDLEKYLEIVDNISNPYGMYKHCRSYSRDNGTHYFRHKKTKKEITHKEYEKLNEVGIKQYVYSRYEANNPNEYVLVICDHISLLTPEKGGTLFDTMRNWSAEYCRKQMTKHWKYVVVNVQQQMSTGEDVTHFKAGKLEPSLDKLGDCKVTQRDALIIVGLYSPFRYGVSEHEGYNITRLKDSYRCLVVLKNRKGRSYLKLPLLFNGQVNKFKELPMPNDPKIEEYYKFANNT